MYYCSVFVCVRQTEREREVSQSTEKTQLSLFVCDKPNISECAYKVYNSLCVHRVIVFLLVFLLDSVINSRDVTDVFISCLTASCQAWMCCKHYVLWHYFKSADASNFFTALRVCPACVFPFSPPKNHYFPQWTEEPLKLLVDHRNQ